MVKKFLFFFPFFCIGKLKVCKTFLVWKFKLTLSVCVAPFFFAGSNLSINPSLLLFSRRGEVTSVLQSNWRCRLAIWQSFSMFCNPKITEWVNRINQKRIFFLTCCVTYASCFLRSLSSSSDVLFLPFSREIFLSWKYQNVLFFFYL